MAAKLADAVRNRERCHDNIAFLQGAHVALDALLTTATDNEPEVDVRLSADSVLFIDLNNVTVLNLDLHL